MAPGSGKTVVSLLIKEKLKPKITIFFVPTIQLIYQQYLSWAEFNSKPFDALVVTSGRITAEDRARLTLLEPKSYRCYHKRVEHYSISSR